MIRLFFILAFLFARFDAEGRICLNMIVKDERDVIRRCLDSVIPVIDEWIIVDTGSTDGTQEIIREHLKGIPGKLFEVPWKNWGETRTEALRLAQQEGNGEYLLFMDADDVLQIEPGADLSSLDQDLYYFWRGTQGFSYRKPQLVKKDLPWKWVGVTHEYLGCDVPFSTETLDEIRYLSLDGGATSKDPSKKFWKNVELLEEGLKKEPGNERYAFYLAESYRDAGEKGKALECYQKRIQMGGWHEETFWAMLQSALLLRDLKLPSSVVVEAFAAAHRFRPHRVEPIYYLAEIYMDQGEHAKAYEWIKAYSLLPKPEERDSLFNIDWMEEYGVLFKLSICSYYLGHYEESLEACDELLQIDSLPWSWREQTKSNREFPLAKLRLINR